MSFELKPIPVPDNWQNLEAHPLAKLIEFGADSDIQGIAGHMRRHGYDPSEPIVLLGTMVLDGRFRQLGAIEAVVVPNFVEFVGDNPLAYVAKKLYRQHLTVAQKAMFAAKISMTIKEKNGQKKIPSIDGSTKDSLPAPTTEKAAKAFGIGTASIDRAKVIETHGSAALKRAVRFNQVSLSDAAAIARQPKSVQDEAIKKVLAKECATLQEAAALRGVKPMTVCQNCYDNFGGTKPKGCPECADLKAKARDRKMQPKPPKRKKQGGIIADAAMIYKQYGDGAVIMKEAVRQFYRLLGKVTTPRAGQDWEAIPDVTYHAIMRNFTELQKLVTALHKEAIKKSEADKPF